MNRGQSSSHRGAALLIVLATLIITMTAMTILVRVASTAQLQARMEACRSAADDLLIVAEAPIRRWLKDESTKVVSPADATSPRFDVLYDRLFIGGQECQLQITAFDQCGMVALNAARGGSPLRLTIPADVLRVIDSLKRDDRTPTQIAGLDWFTGSNNDLRARLVFPIEQLHVGQPTIGEMIATHSGKASMVNINTAPMPLVEAAMRLAGRGGIEQVLAARKSGKLASLGSQASPTNGDTKFIPQIVTTSNCWSFRIDIHVGPLWRSWWAVYQSGQTGKWECVQRLAITE